MRAVASAVHGSIEEAPESLEFDNKRHYLRCLPWCQTQACNQVVWRWGGVLWRVGIDAARECLRGNMIRGNRTESLWEGKRVSERVSESRCVQRVFRGPLRDPLRDPLRGRFPSQRLSVLLPLVVGFQRFSEALSPVAPSHVAPWTFSKMRQAMSTTLCCQPRQQVGLQNYFN